MSAPFWVPTRDLSDSGTQPTQSDSGSQPDGSGLGEPDDKDAASDKPPPPRPGILGEAQLLKLNPDIITVCLDRQLSAPESTETARGFLICDSFKRPVVHPTTGHVFYIASDKRLHRFGVDTNGKRAPWTDADEPLQIENDRLVETACEPLSFWVDPQDGSVTYLCPEAEGFSYASTNGAPVAIPERVRLVALGYRGFKLVLSEGNLAILTPEGDLIQTGSNQTHEGAIRATPAGFILTSGVLEYAHIGVGGDALWNTPVLRWHISYAGQVGPDGAYPLAPMREEIEMFPPYRCAFDAQGDLWCLGFSRHDLVGRHVVRFGLGEAEAEVIGSVDSSGLDYDSGLALITGP